MKDIKTFLIGFLTCACLFLIMGQTNVKKFGHIEAESVQLKKDGILYGLLSTEGYFIFDGTPEAFQKLNITKNGDINLINKNQEVVVTLQVNGNHDGVLGLYDRYGDMGWGMTGKKGQYSP